MIDGPRSERQKAVSFLPSISCSFFFFADLGPAELKGSWLGLWLICFSGWMVKRGLASSAGA